jgi:hypothetical protein
MIKKIVITICMTAFILIAADKTDAQETDFGTWLSFELTKEITKKFDLEFEEEIRIFEKFREINRFGTSVGGSYSLNKYVKGGAGYTWLYRHDVKDQLWENRQRYYIYLRGRFEVGRITFSLHEKFQSTYCDSSVPGFDYSPENYLRSRLQAEYDLKGNKATPYIGAEMHYQLNNPDGNEIDDMRYTLGIDFPLTKKLGMDTYLRMDQEMNVKNPVNLYLIGINLKMKL